MDTKVWQGRVKLHLTPAAFCCGVPGVRLLNCPALFVSRTVAENRMLAAANFKL